MNIIEDLKKIIAENVVYLVMFDKDKKYITFTGEFYLDPYEIWIKGEIVSIRDNSMQLCFHPHTGFIKITNKLKPYSFIGDVEYVQFHLIGFSKHVILNRSNILKIRLGVPVENLLLNSPE